MRMNACLLARSLTVELVDWLTWQVRVSGANIGATGERGSLRLPSHQVEVPLKLGINL